jgi:hypothetical protein
MINGNGVNYLAIGGSVHNQQIVQQFPVNSIEIDVNGQPQVYRRIPVPVFDMGFDVLVYEPLTLNRKDLSNALANALLSPNALALWEAGSPLAPQSTRGDGQGTVAPTAQQPAVEDNASR